MVVGWPILVKLWRGGLAGPWWLRLIVIGSAVGGTLLIDRLPIWGGPAPVIRVPLREPHEDVMQTRKESMLAGVADPVAVWRMRRPNRLVPQELREDQ